MNNHPTMRTESPLPAVVQLADLTADGCLTVDQAGEFLQLGRNAIYNAIAAGQLPTCKFGRATRVPKRALVLYAAAHLTGGWAMVTHSQCDSASEVIAGQQLAGACCQSVAKQGRA